MAGWQLAVSRHSTLGHQPQSLSNNGQSGPGKSLHLLKPEATPQELQLQPRQVTKRRPPNERETSLCVDPVFDDCLLVARELIGEQQRHLPQTLSVGADEAQGAACA